MKITILDGHNVNPGDVTWDTITPFGELSVFDRTPPELVTTRISGSEIILLNKVRITAEILDACPALRYIGVLATGYNVVDTAACRTRNICVTNIPSYSTDAVAQHVFAFILEFTNRIAVHNDSVKNGDWIKNPDFCYWLTPLTELAGKTIGIYGFGNIGQQVARIAHAFGMQVLVHVHTPASFTGGETAVTTEELFARSDFITLHAPMTSETDHFVTAALLAHMKKTAILINTARGALVNEHDIRTALESKTIGGYAADVLETEPMAAACPFAGAPNSLITPHIAWAPREARLRLLSIAAANIAAFLKETPQNVVS
jgi:glycerate dehydrogenase